MEGNLLKKCRPEWGPKGMGFLGGFGVMLSWPMRPCLGLHEGDSKKGSTNS